MDLLSLFEGHLRYELNYSSHTLEAYIRDIRQFIEWLAPGREEEFRPENVTVADIRAWLAALSRKGLTPRSIRRKAQSVRALFKFLLKERKITMNPASDLILPKLSKPLPEIIRSSELEKIFRLASELKENFQTKEQDDISETSELQSERILENLVLEILYSLGLRRAELALLNDEDIRINPPELKVTGKRNKQRVVPLPMSLLQHINDWRRLRDSECLIIENPKPLFVKNGKRITPAQIYRIVHKNLAGVTAGKKSPHALRHTFATSMLNEGADLNSVKEFLGHASLATTQIYTHISFREIKNAYAKAHPRMKK